MLTTIPYRAWRRLARMKPLSIPAMRVEDNLEDFLFWAHVQDWRRARDEYLACNSIADYFEFSQRLFGPHQRAPEITGLLEFVSKIGPRNVCEIGTAAGGTTFLLGQALPTVGRMLGVDLMVRRERRLKFFARPHQQLEFFNGSSYAPETFARVRDHLAGEQLDFLFIDGDHTFDGAARDFEMYRHLVRDGGIIAFHDIVPDFGTRFGTRTQNWTGDVPRVWEAIKPHYRTEEFVESPGQDGFGIGALWYSADVTPPRLVP